MGDLFFKKIPMISTARARSTYRPGDGKNRAQRGVAHGFSSNNARSIASPIAR
jgi:hypothetical protein